MSKATGASAPDFAGMIASEMKKQLSPLDGLLKTLNGPASAAGMTPQQLLGELTRGQEATSFMGYAGQGVKQIKTEWGKTSGIGPMCRALAKRCYPGLNLVGEAEAQKTLTDLGMELKATTPLAENSGVTGGYTVPPQFVQQLLTLSVEEQVVAPRASKQPMTSMTLQVPSLDYTTVQGAGNTPFLGGVIPEWVAEAQTRPQTEPQFRQTELKAWELSLYTVASNNLLQDNAVGLDSLLTQLFSKAIGWYTDYAYIRGDGVGKPLGMLNAPATIVVNRAAGNRFGFSDYTTMMAKLLMQSWDSAVWLMHQSVLPQVTQMVDQAGRVIFIPFNSGATQKSPGTLGGRPIYYTEKASALGTKGDVMLFDCSLYLLGVRLDIEIAVSPHVRFLQNQMVWRVVWRGDGQPWLQNPITLADGSYTVSPFVVLQ